MKREGDKIPLAGTWCTGKVNPPHSFKTGRLIGTVCPNTSLSPSYCEPQIWAKIFLDYCATCYPKRRKNRAFFKCLKSYFWLDSVHWRFNAIFSLAPWLRGVGSVVRSGNCETKDYIFVYGLSTPVLSVPTPLLHVLSDMKKAFVKLMIHPVISESQNTTDKHLRNDSSRGWGSIHCAIKSRVKWSLGGCVVIFLLILPLQCWNPAP